MHTKKTVKMNTMQCTGNIKIRGIQYICLNHINFQAT
jgi:hypothetical protein